MEQELDQEEDDVINLHEHRWSKWTRTLAEMVNFSEPLRKTKSNGKKRKIGKKSSSKEYDPLLLHHIESRLW